MYHQEHPARVPSLVLLPRRNPVAAAISLALGAAALAAVAHSFAQGDLAAMADWGAISSAVFGLLLAHVGWILMAPRGGLWVGAEGLRLGGSNAEDALVVGAKAIRTVAVRSQCLGTTPDSPVGWSVEAQTSPGGAVLLGVALDEGDALELQAHVTHLLGRHGDAAATSEPSAADAEPLPPSWRVGPGWALSSVVALVGIAASAWGILLTAQVEVNPLSGFLFGPPLAGLGLALLGLWVVRALAHEAVRFEGSSLIHTMHIGRFTLLHRTVELTTDSRARLRSRGARGWLIEIVAEHRRLPMAPGARARHSRLGPSDALRITQALDRAISTHRPPIPREPEPLADVS